MLSRLLNPQTIKGDWRFAKRMLAKGARAALPPNVVIGEVSLRDKYGNNYAWVKYDTNETGLTKRIGMPVGWSASSGGSVTRTVTGDFSDSAQKDFVGLLTAVPTASLPYVLVIIEPDNIANTAVGAMTLTTDGNVGLGDPIGWVDDDLIGSNHLCGGSPKAKHPFDSYDCGVAITADSGTTLSNAKLTRATKTQLPDPSKVTYFVQSRDWEAGDAAFLLSGDSGATLAPSRTNTTANVHKLVLTPDTTANDEASATSNNLPFLFASGKRIRFSAHITYTDAAGALGGFIAGFAKTLGAGTANYIADTTGAFGNAATLEGMGVGKEELADLQLNHFFSDGSNLDTNSDENLHTIVSGTEFSVMIAGTPTTGGITTAVNGTVAGTALDGGVTGAEQLYAIVYTKAVAGTTAPVVAIRDAIWAVEI